MPGSGRRRAFRGATALGLLLAAGHSSRQIRMAVNVPSMNRARDFPYLAATRLAHWKLSSFNLTKVQCSGALAGGLGGLFDPFTILAQPTMGRYRKSTRKTLTGNRYRCSLAVMKDEEADVQPPATPYAHDLAHVIELAAGNPAWASCSQDQKSLLAVLARLDQLEGENARLIERIHRLEEK